jgi:eukaryotic-like serine/threonine-protein kinase
MSIPNSTTLRSTSPASAQPALFGGKYLLEELIGEGGMGSVWRARNVMLDLPVALKRVHPDARSADSSARLLTEARVEAKLRHPGIVSVFDYGETTEGDTFIVMELLEGRSLAALLEDGPTPPVTAVRLMLPIIHALHTAHCAGVVHRDLKPENIFLAHAGSHVQPKLLDFGIAKLNDEPCVRVTDDGSLLGSPAYMAPEQARGFDDVDHRADVWAACVVLYELITGRPAFDADNPYAVLRAVIENELSPLQGEECESLWPILARGLAKDRRHRIQSALELGTALARWLLVHGETEDACGEPLAWNWNLYGSAPACLFDLPAHAATSTPATLAPTWKKRPSARRAPVRSGMRRRMAQPAWAAILRVAGVFAVAPVAVLLLGQGFQQPPATLRSLAEQPRPLPVLDAGHATAALARLPRPAALGSTPSAASAVTTQPIAELTLRDGLQLSAADDVPASQPTETAPAAASAQLAAPASQPSAADERSALRREIEPAAKRPPARAASAAKPARPQQELAAPPAAQRAHSSVAALGLKDPFR